MRHGCLRFFISSSKHLRWCEGVVSLTCWDEQVANKFFPAPSDRKSPRSSLKRVPIELTYTTTAHMLLRKTRPFHSTTAMNPRTIPSVKVRSSSLTRSQGGVKLMGLVMACLGSTSTDADMVCHEAERDVLRHVHGQDVSPFLKNTACRVI